MNELKASLKKKLSLVSGKNLKELMELRESCDLAIQFEIQTLAVANGLSHKAAMHMFPQTVHCDDLLKILGSPD